MLEFITRTTFYGYHGIIYT